MQVVLGKGFDAWGIDWARATTNRSGMHPMWNPRVTSTFSGIHFNQSQAKERAMGFEPTTSALGRLHSTTELRPHGKPKRLMLHHGQFSASIGHVKVPECSPRHGTTSQPFAGDLPP